MGVLFYDSRSTLTLCWHDWAQQAGYTGRPVSIYLKGLAQSYEKVDTKEYDIILLDTAGRQLKVTAIGLDALTQEVRSKDARRAYQRFPKVPCKQLERPEGQVDLLIGLDHSGYLPVVEKT